MRSNAAHNPRILITRPGMVPGPRDRRSLSWRLCLVGVRLDAELVRLGYKDSTMVWYRGCWRRIERLFAARGMEEFSLEAALAWVDEPACGFFDKEQAGTLMRLPLGSGHRISCGD